MATTQASSTDPDSATAAATSAAKRYQFAAPQTDHKPAGRSQLPRQAQASSTAAPRPSVAKIIEAQEEIFIRRQPESARLAGVAGGSLAGGVVSSWQISRPQPVWLSHGQGSKL
ncbi:MAG TPA: hypothetical protein VGI66_12930, partial [Streptosporangiaceae bacterium]